MKLATQSLWLALIVLALGAGVATAAEPSDVPLSFRRGDTNVDSTVDLSDGLASLRFLFLGGDRPVCLDAADADDSGEVELTDASYTFTFLFLGGGAPPAPGLECGVDTTTDRLDCLSYEACTQAPVDKNKDRVPDPALRLTGGGALDVELPIISEFPLAVEAAQFIEVETTNLSEGSDPVLHLVVKAPHAEICQRCAPLPFGGEVCVPYPCNIGTQTVELVSDDDGGEGANAKVRYKVPSGGEVFVLVRARTSDVDGTCDLLLDGQPWQENVEFSGLFVNLQNVRTGETLDTIRQPNGAGAGHFMLSLAEDRISLLPSASRAGLAGGLTSSLLEDGWAVFGVPQTTLPGDARIVRNDAALDGHDGDRDGLGKELEEDLGLCPALSGIAYGQIPRWRLDILEARYVRLCDEQAETDEERDECVAEYLRYLDDHSLTEFDCSLAVDARDTDGDGISDGDEVLGARRSDGDQALPLWGADPLHKDMFVEVDFMIRDIDEEALRMPPETARKYAGFYQDDVRIFSYERRGDHADSLVNPDGLPGIDVHMDTGVEPEGPEDVTTYGDWGGYTAVPPIPDGDGGWTGVTFTTAWKDHMSPARYGLFRYQLPYATGGGSNPLNHIASSGGLNSVWVLAHEAGHANGIHHYGPNWSELRGVNCKTNYVSLMNYAFNSGRVGFSDGQNAAPLNNMYLTEWQAANEEAYLDVLKNTYGYYVDYENGHVDWNRDGEFAPEGKTVRAQANNRYYGSCEGTRLNNSVLPDSVSFVSPALARLGERFYLFYSAGNLRYNVSTSEWNCPRLLEEGEVCGTWEDWRSAPLNATQGVDAVKFGSNSEPELLVVTNDFRGFLWESRLYIDGKGQERWTNPVRVPTDFEAVGEPSLVRWNSCMAYLAFKNADGNVVLKTLSHEEGWSGDEVVTLAVHGAQPTIWEHASPGIVRAYLDWKPDTPVLYGAFADRIGRFQLYGYDPITRRWESTGMVYRVWRKVAGRPTMQWVPETTQEETPGRLHIAFGSQETDPNRVGTARERRILTTIHSYVQVTEQADGTVTKEPKIGQMADFDNVWLHGYGIDFFYESGVDSNLKAAFSRLSGDSEKRRVSFRPVADGVVDYTYSDHDDWEALRVGVCRNVVNPAGLIDDPIECPAVTWDVRDDKRGGDRDGDDDHDHEEDNDKRDLFEPEPTEDEIDEGTDVALPLPGNKNLPQAGGAQVSLPAGFICPEDLGPIFDGGIIPPFGGF